MHVTYIRDHIHSTVIYERTPRTEFQSSIPHKKKENVSAGEGGVGKISSSKLPVTVPFRHPLHYGVINFESQSSRMCDYPDDYGTAAHC